jgi:hypothetical protein
MDTISNLEAKMNDKKRNNGFEQLSREELDEVTGGIPYEKPGLILFAAGKSSCIDGGYCKTGYVGTKSCNVGYSCGTGEPVPEE